MFGKVLRIVVIPLAAIIALVAGPVAGPAGAQAPREVSANAGVYGVAPQWWGWCPKGPGFMRTNKVTQVWYVNHTTGDQYRDSGDDIIWIRVRTGQTNNVTFGVQCRWNTPQGMNYSFRPSRNGQTWWFGYPTGQRSN